MIPRLVPGARCRALLITFYAGETRESIPRRPSASRARPSILSIVRSSGRNILVLLRIAPAEGDASLLHIHADRVLGSELPLEDRLGERVFEPLLDCPLEGTRPVDRVVTGGGDLLQRGFAHFEPDLHAGEPLLEIAQL